MAAPHTDALDLVTAKRAARARALAARRGCDPALGGALAAHVLRSAPPPDGAVVAGFWPLDGEIDVRPLLLALAARGHPLVLPRTPARGLPLTFHAWHPGDVLLAGPFGTRHPAGPERAPDVVLVPLLAFDRRGHRLGYGAGYYDRTLPLHPGARLLGCAFAAQELDAVPVGSYDVPLPAIATDRGVIVCPSGGPVRDSE